MRDLRIAIVGAGAIARRGHIPAIKALGLNLVGIADINEEIAKRVAAEFRIPRYFTDYKEMLEQVRPDVVIVCTPTPTHYEIAKTCIEHGCHTLVEKPLCTSVKEVKELVKLAEEQRVVVGVVYNYRYFKAVRQVKQIIASGRLGRVLTISGLCLTHFPIEWTRSTWLYSNGGVLYDAFPHILDLMMWFASDLKPIRVFATGNSYLPGADFITHANLLVELEGGVTLVGVASWLAGTRILRINVHGTGGHIFLDVRGDEYKEIHGIPIPIPDLPRILLRTIRMVRGVISGYLFLGALAHYPQLIADFILAVRGKREYHPTAAEELLRIAILEAALASIRERRVVELKNLVQDLR